MALCACAWAGCPWRQEPSSSSREPLSLKGPHVHGAAARTGAQHAPLPSSAALRAAEPRPSARKASLTVPGKSGASSRLADKGARSDTTPEERQTPPVQAGLRQPPESSRVYCNLGLPSVRLPVLRDQLERSPRLPLPPLETPWLEILSLPQVE